MVKLKNLLTEGVDHTYVLDFQNYFEKKYKGKKVDGWEFSIDRHAGTFLWDSNKTGTVIMATPFWEDRAEVPVNIMDVDGEDLIDTSYPFKPSGDFKKDEAKYLKILKPIFKALR